MVNLPRFCEDENRHREKQEIVGDDVVHEVNERPVDIHGLNWRSRQGLILG